MTALFVTSSGTGIGKTLVCCRLLESLSDRRSAEAARRPGAAAVRCIKPVITGFNPAAPAESDTGRLLDAQRLAIDPGNIEATSPWRFRAALSADMAAAREDRTVPFDDLVAFSRPRAGVDLTLIEGIGGVMAPIDSSHTVLDWIAALDASVLLVVGSYLGTLSHTLTAAAVLAERKRGALAVVVSESQAAPAPIAETAASLASHCAGVPIVTLPRDDEAGVAAAIASIRRLLALPQRT